MKIAVIGGTGIVGTGVVNLLKQEHEVISIGKSRGDYQVDLSKPEQIQQLFNDIPNLDGVICTVGDGKMGSLLDLKPEDFQFAFQSKLIGSFNLVKEAINHLPLNGFIILTSGIASMQAIPNVSALSVACAALEAFVRSASVENTNDIRINAVSPAMVKETMELFGMDSSTGISALDTAKVFKYLIDTKADGVIVNVHDFIEN